MRVLGVVVVVAACGSAGGEIPDFGTPPQQSVKKPAPSREPKLNPRLLRRFRAIETVDETEASTVARIALGKQLFFDRRLSRDGDLSCSSCHALDRGGVDGRPTSIGAEGAHGKRNAPTVLNAANQASMFWDGRAADLEEQARGPLLAKGEMANDPTRVTRTLQSIPGYVQQFGVAFPDDKSPVDFGHAAKAIAAFEQTLVTPSRWDRYLGGDTKALEADELEGMKVFADVGCVQCHTGDLIGGRMFQRAGLVVPWPNQQDQGRYEVTHLASDRMVFKVPSLRNVTLTGPYFHDGSVADLDQAIRLMGTHQLGVELTDPEVKAIHRWLATLEGKLSPEVSRPPVLPPGGLAIRVHK